MRTECEWWLKQIKARILRCENWAGALALTTAKVNDAKFNADGKAVGDRPGRPNGRTVGCADGRQLQVFPHDQDVLVAELKQGL